MYTASDDPGQVVVYFYHPPRAAIDNDYVWLQFGMRLPVTAIEPAFRPRWTPASRTRDGTALRELLTSAGFELDPAAPARS